jgi:hypothetical protein
MPTVRHLIFVMLVILVCAGCESRPPATDSVSPTEEMTSTVEVSPGEEGTETAEAMPATEAAASAAESTPVGEMPVTAQPLLVELTTESTHQLTLLDQAGLITPLLDVPSRTVHVSACGDQPTSPDSHFLALYVGNTAGRLYVMKDANPPAYVDDVEYLSCLGHDSLQFAPDSSQFAYIDYPSSITGLEYATGILRIYDTASMSEAVRFENVTAFDLGADQTFFVSLFANNRSEADEAAVSLWDGSAARELVTLIPTGERCRFTSAAIARAPDARAALVLGQRCSSGNTATQWQFYTVDAQANSATLVTSNYQPGSFVPYARTNNVFFSPDSAFAFFTVPDGVTTSTGAVATVDFTNLTLSVPIPSQAVFPAYSAPANALPRFSPDRRWLALVVTSPDRDNQLVALDLTNPNMPPIAIRAGSRGDLISGMAFTPDSTQIIYVAGDTDGGDNTLLALNLTVGSERRIARAHFGGDLVVSADGAAVTLLDWKRVENPREPLYADLVRVDLASDAVTTLVAGAAVVDGHVTNLQTVVPLAWR